MSISLVVILAFVVAFLAAFASTPFARELAIKIGAIDVPKDSRRMHKIPTPRLGGIAIFLRSITLWHSMRLSVLLLHLLLL